MNPVVHFEMPYQNAERAAAFYSGVFGWKIQFLGEEMGNYLLVTTLETDVVPEAYRGGINGGLFPHKPDWPAQYPSVVLGVENIRETIQRIESAGGKVLGEPVEIPGFGHYVSFLDPEGNRNSVVEPFPRT